MIHPLPRLYPILDTQAAARRGAAPVDLARTWLAAGAGILQYRHKGHWSRETFAEAEAVAALCFQAAVPFVINDRADIAALLGAGLHVGQDDLLPTDARRIIGPDALLGYSTHNEAQLRQAAAQPADYLALGPIFVTGSKENPDPVVGLENLKAWRAITPKPLVAIGGITLQALAQVFEAGADSAALISALLDVPQAFLPVLLSGHGQETRDT